MKDLLCDEKGDIVISDHDLQYVKDKALIRQKVQLTLSTNKTEWEYNPNEGIDFFAMLTKNPDEDQVYSTIHDGIRQVDEGFKIDKFEMETVKRKMQVTFTASLDGDTATYTVGQTDNGIRAVQS